MAGEGIRVTGGGSTGYGSSLEDGIKPSPAREASSDRRDGEDAFVPAPEKKKARPPAEKDSNALETLFSWLKFW